MRRLYGKGRLDYKSLGPPLLPRKRETMRKSAMERAFELARSGRFKIGRDIDRTLKVEGYSNGEIAYLTLGSVRKDLMRVCREAQSSLATECTKAPPVPERASEA